MPTKLEQELFGNQITREAWTAATVCEDLPDAEVRCNGAVMPCLVCGRLNEFAVNN